MDGSYTVKHTPTNDCYIFRVFPVNGSHESIFNSNLGKAMLTGTYTPDISFGAGLNTLCQSSSFNYQDIPYSQLPVVSKIEGYNTMIMNGISSYGCNPRNIFQLFDNVYYSLCIYNVKGIPLYFDGDKLGDRFMYRRISCSSQHSKPIFYNSISDSTVNILIGLAALSVFAICLFSEKKPVPNNR